MTEIGPCFIPPEARSHALHRDPFGAKILVRKYDVLYGDILAVAGLQDTRSRRSKVSAVLGGYEKNKIIEEALLKALRYRGATESELTPIETSFSTRRYAHARLRGE